MGYSPGFLLKNVEFLTLGEITPNRYRKSRKELEIYLQAFWRRFREFGAISRTCQNPPLFKTMGYSPGFLLKNGEFVTLAKSPQIDTESPARS